MKKRKKKKHVKASFVEKINYIDRCTLYSFDSPFQLSQVDF